ncbi:hypothetical protein Lal_00002494 [Lupinus albus]|nr:hypothetical protein Lal_00002494 [Lupinus albus]
MASSDVVWLNIWPLPTIMSSLFSAAISKTSDVLSCSPRMRRSPVVCPFRRSSTNNLGPEISGLFTSQPTFTCMHVCLLQSLPGSEATRLARSRNAHPSNILVLDEATAAVDVETDAMLQSTLRSPLFANRTIITVAHRLNTILDSDRVVVLDKGEVVEFDSPAELFKKQGVFYGLMKQAGLERNKRGGIFACITKQSKENHANAACTHSSIASSGQEAQILRDDAHNRISCEPLAKYG